MRAGVAEVEKGVNERERESMVGQGGKTEGARGSLRG